MGKAHFATNIAVGLVLVLFFGYSQAQVTGISGSMNAVQALQRFQHNADQFFDDQRYVLAQRDYLKLSKLSDKYSQYRLAYMFYHGLGMPRDLIEAYAWSYVSAESNRADFVAFHKQVKSQLDEALLDAARERAAEYLAEAGLYRAAINARKLITREKRSCTGSRLGSSCDRVAVTSATCNANIGSTPSKRCLVMGSLGLPGVAGLLPLQLRSVERALDQFIAEYDPGRVELGELEIIED